MGIPVIEQAKIQAQVLVPLVKVLQSELGKERAHALVRKALGDLYRRLGEQWWRARESGNVGENVASAFAAFAEGFDSDVRLTRTQTIMQGASRCDFRHRRQKD